MASTIALITGGTGALGTAVVSQLLQDGFACHVTWTHARELERFELRDRVTLHQADCTDEDAVRALYAALPRLDAAVHVVGGFAMSALAETSAQTFEAMWRLNTLSALLCTREAVVAMRRRDGAGIRGRIVNVAARPALVPTAGMVAYATSKAGVAALTQAIAEETRAEGILVNAIVPSTMDTPANRAAMPQADHARWPKLPEVAATIAWLVGADNHLTTGTLVPVYGRSV